MRIAVLNWSSRKVGGAESYLGLTISALAGAGHAVAFWHQTDEPAGREPIPLPAGVPSWSAAELGTARALERLREWRPDLIYSHGLLDPAVEAETLRIAPAVFSAHNYYGTCISGNKTFTSPTVTPCRRQFGWQCLLHYYPRRCGGLSPVTMLQLFAVQSKRLELLRHYGAILTFSRHMSNEYVSHGLPAERVHSLSYYTQNVGEGQTAGGEPAAPGARPHRPGPAIAERPLRGDGFNLLFIGRMDRLKGGRTLLDALPQVRARLGRPLSVTFVGDGPERRAWQRAARRAQDGDEGVRVGFAGWATREQIDAHLAESDLLVFPSLWPEPFGLAGPEAGYHGVPVAAFAVGGIPDWLVDGVNGHLAPGDPPTAGGLAEAIVRCLADPAEHARLSRGAREMAQKFSVQNHLPALLEIFEGVVRGKAGACSP